MEEIIFTKRLCSTDANKKLIVPTESLSKFNLPDDQHFKEFEATDTMGKRWNFKLTTRKNDPRGNRRPEITGRAWLQFVREKGLAEGKNFEVTLSKKVDEATGDERYFIKAEFKLFGAGIDLPIK